MTGTRISDMTALDTASTAPVLPLVSGTTNYKMALPAMPVGLFTSLGTVTIPTGVTRIYTTGYSSATVAVNAASAASYALDSDQSTANTGTMSRWRRQDAAGRYWRLADPNPYLEMFGAVGDTILSSSLQTDNIDAFTAFQAWALLHYTYDHTTSAEQLEGFGVLRVGHGGFYFSSTIDLKSGTFRLIGQSTGHVGSGIPTTFYFPADTDGIRVQNTNTTGNTLLAVAAGRGSNGSYIQGITLWGSGGTTGSGIWLRARATLKEVYAINFGAHGFRIEATAGGAVEGNVNNWVMLNCSAANNRLDGLFLDGADVNAGYSIGFNARFNGRFGIYDSAFLCNTHVGAHVEFCGLKDTSGLISSKNTSSSVCSYGGNLYGVLIGQSVAAATSQPDISPTVWGFISAGGATGEKPAWTNGGQTWIDGGSYCSDNSNAKTVFLGVYAEGGQNLAQGSSATMYLGGQVGLLPGTPGAHLRNVGGFLANLATGISRTTTNGTRTIRVQFGESAREDTYLFIEDDQQGGTGNAWRLLNSSGDILFQHDLLAARTPFHISGPSTAQEYGRGVAQPYFINLIKVAIGNGADARVMDNATTAPAAGTQAQGEIYWNRAPTLGSVVAWRCITLGTPGTFEAIVGGLNTVGIGYVTGAGGTVTQATSRTTGVTLNKLSGAITLVSAAGSASWQTFTVTNSTVAATDTIIVNQKSGTDLNMIHVTAVAAGSFNISFATTGGTTVETPVFNFNVVKGVAA